MINETRGFHETSKIRHRRAGLALLPFSAQALLFDAEVGAAFWSHSPSGHMGTGDGNFDADDELGFGRENGFFGWAKFEPMLLPNIRVAYTPLDFDGSGRVDRTLRFGDIEVDAGQDVDSKLSLDQLDATIYIQPLSNVVSLGVGLNVRLMDGEAQVTANGQTDRISFSGPIPMLYGNAGVALPFTGLSANAEASAIAYSGNRLIDAQIGLRYHVAPFVRVEAGYRRYELKLDDFDDIDVDLSIDGPYLGLVARF
ncbi:hypothetical protein CAI21_03650 [Alkalilimnicola ehrlichii]|uniref:Outer membrane protein n=1 Tax=Alkalilimnicola ehrlichii TaxID=351052 RepID=A0A3E0WYU5_9GAMM|nr:TIGR04219 family outer membrane beta-barrel protein [Alkalilimnicola ehrlichii]RFA30624.1 hypothetical protein CAI21_03650 [Alkalilimnicola ehrlichii]RFA38206.1 hypothetical protein CAL65_05010 [Alkalilimnicola ehrlichii]